MRTSFCSFCVELSLWNFGVRFKQWSVSLNLLLKYSLKTELSVKLFWQSKSIVSSSANLSEKFSEGSSFFKDINSFNSLSSFKTLASSLRFVLIELSIFSSNLTTLFSITWIWDSIDFIEAAVCSWKVFHSFILLLFLVGVCGAFWLVEILP